MFQQFKQPYSNKQTFSVYDEKDAKLFLGKLVLFLLILFVDKNKNNFWTRYIVLCL